VFVNTTNQRELHMLLLERMKEIDEKLEDMPLHIEEIVERLLTDFEVDVIFPLEQRLDEIESSVS
jgi:hypothetical protein